MSGRTIVVLLALGFILGCANRPTKEAFIERAQAWVGRNADELVIKVGPPTSTFTLSNGDRVFEYQRSQNVTTGGGSYTMPTTTYIPGGPLGGTFVQGQQVHQMPVSSGTLTCNVRYVVDKNNIITSWSADGNACVARPAPK